MCDMFKIGETATCGLIFIGAVSAASMESNI